MRLLKKMMICWLALSIPAALFSYTIDQMTNEIFGHFEKIKLLTADFSNVTSGTGNTRAQKGHFSYSIDAGSVYRIDEPGKVEAVIKNDGTAYINGQKQSSAGSESRMGDLYLLSLMSHYQLEIGGENSNTLTVYGYEKNTQSVPLKLFTAYYNKNSQVIERVNYKGNKKDFPYVLQMGYTNMQGVPVLGSMTTLLSAFSVTVTTRMTFYNIHLELK